MTAPEIDWAVARRIGSWAGGALPAVTRREAIEEVASLRLAAARARGLVERQFGPPGPSYDVRVVDRAGWQRAAATMVDRIAAAMDLRRRPPGRLTSARGVLGGLVAGAGLGIAGRLLLGQYDPLGRTLYLVAPTILAVRRRHGIAAPDFHLWVCLHEQTHAAQFAAAPWLEAHFVAQLEQVSRGKRVDDALALMTFLEGHADLITDRAAQRRVSSLPMLRAAFRRRPGPARRGLLGTLDKAAQYRDGLAFCRAATRRRRRALDAAFEDPANLPSLDEIADPAAWVARVHG
ncbi:MAG TPA: zinc-dependent metalloprotease [Arachnia sp.]|nr:zinc-dependent metalloprotease [Arachnia sp.]HMT85777.1 zinc-dependent metalloprotease [Arachnia sp.]